MYSEVATAGFAPALMLPIFMQFCAWALGCLYIPALVAVWGVATPLKFVHSFHTLLAFAPFTMVGFLCHS